MNNKSNRLLERELKSIVLNYFLIKGKIDKNSIIINELTLDNFSRRADLALISNDKFIALEIKSEADSLYRLDGQTQKYLDYFDKVIVVSVDKHIPSIIKSVPSNVEVWEVIDGVVKIKKRGRIVRISDKLKYLDFFKRNDLIKLNKKLNVESANKTKSEMKNDLIYGVKNMSFKSIRELSLDIIKDRFNATSSLFFNAISIKGNVSPDDVELLSPYVNDRNVFKENKITNHSIWSNWKEGLEEDPLLAKLAKTSDSPIFGDVPEIVRKLLDD